jgi:hypothetical protein
MHAGKVPGGVGEGSFDWNKHMRTAALALLTLVIVTNLLAPQVATAIPLRGSASAHPVAASISPAGSRRALAPSAGWLSPWTLVVAASAQASLRVDSSTTVGSAASAAVRVTSAMPTAAWNIALVDHNLSLVAGTTYTLSFWAKCTSVQRIDFGIQEAVSPWHWQAFRSVTLSRRWQSYSLRFAAPVTEAHDKAQFDLGYGVGTTWINNAVFAPMATEISQASTSPSGQPMPVGDLPGWHQIFADDFTINAPVGSFPGAVYGSNWAVYPDGTHDTTHNGQYWASKVLSVSNGMLNMYIHTENGIHMVAAPMPILRPSPDNEGLLYGRYSVRFRADAIPNYKTAWLLWPDSENWPTDGEIDFPEGDMTSTMNASMHWQNGTSGGDQDKYSTNVTYTSWHTATTEWTPNAVTFYLDGQVIGRSTSHIPNTPMHWVLQTETNLNGIVPSATDAGNVQVDWAVAYSYQP